MNKIPFYKERNFGEKMGATIDFLSQNLRYVWRYLLYAIVPTGIIYGLMINWIYYIAFTRISTPLGVVAWLVMLVVGFFGLSYLFGLIFSIMQLYNNRENGLEGITYADLKPYMKDNVKRMRIYLLGLIPLFIAIGLVAALLTLMFSVFGLLFWFVLSFFVIVAYQLVMPVYLNEDIKYWDAVVRGVRLSWNTFGGVLLLMFVIGIICNLINMILGVPWYVVFFVKLIAIDEGTADSIANTPWFDTLSYVCSMLMGIGSFASSLLMVIAMNYQYANAAEQEDGFSVDEEIEDFEQM